MVKAPTVKKGFEDFFVSDLELVSSNLVAFIIHCKYVIIFW